MSFIFGSILSQLLSYRGKVLMQTKGVWKVKHLVVKETTTLTIAMLGQPSFFFPFFLAI